MTKKIISLILSVVMMVSLVPSTVMAASYSVETLLYAEDFESYEVGAKPQMDVYESTSNIAVAKIGATKALHIKNINGTSNAAVEKKIDRIENKPVDVTVKFMQTQTGSSKNKVIELCDGNAGFAVYANAGKLYIGETELCDYLANKWQTIEIKIDFYNALLDVYVNGLLKADNVAIETKGIDKLAVSASQSPGFYIDDISVKSSQTVSEMHIDGVEAAVIPRNGENEYKFSVFCKDENGEKITVSNIDWTYLPADYQGITTAETADGFLIKIASDAPEGEIALTASLDGGAYSESKTVRLEKVSATDIRVDGAVRIAGENGRTYKYGYEVVMNDQNGDAVDNYGDFVWSMTGLDDYEIPSYISLDANTGIITVTADTPYREFLEIKATSIDTPDVWTKKKILITDHDSLTLDNMRYDAVKTHIDNVMQYAKDPYDDTPLLTDLINPTAKAPAATLLANGELEISSNIGAQSNLLRSIVNLSNFEDDDTYREYVKEIYKYTMDISPEYYLYQGGHMEVDLKTKKPNKYLQTRQTGIHESKSGYTYYTPLFWVDYDRAELLMKSAFTGHAGAAVDGWRWKHMQIGRHWYVQSSVVRPDNVDYFWQDTEAYDWDRKGAVMQASDCQFMIGYSEMLSLLSQYYESARTEEEKEQCIAWGDIVYSSLDQTGYDPITGKYTGMFNETNGSKYYPDWSNIHATWEKYGKNWYDKTNYINYVPGDRFFSNMILGDRDIRPVSEGGEGFGPSSDGKSWINNHYNPDPYKGVNEENWMYFLEPYMFTRENSCITAAGPGILQFCDTIPEDSPIRTKIIEKYANSIYNYLNLRYNWKTSHFDAMMSWGLNVQDWEAPHAGYYHGEGSRVSGKVPEMTLIEPMTTLVYQAVKLAEETDENEMATNTYPENKRKAQLMEQAEYIWNVLRNICKVNFQLGDIGDPFNDIPSDLNFGSTGTNEYLIRGLTIMYRLFGDENYLKLACIIANNALVANYDEGVGLFAKKGAIITSSSTRYLPTLLTLEATLLDDYDNLIEAEQCGMANAYWHVYTLDEHGVNERVLPIETLPGLSENGVKQQMLLIEDSFKMKVGESKKINYSVLPYDASTSVIWDVSDSEIADITPDGVITTHKNGTVEIRCVSGSVKGLASKTIVVTVE